MKARDPAEPSRPKQPARGRQLVTAASLLVLTTTLSVCLPRPAAAEERLQFGHLGSEQGLASIWVQAILRDWQGFLWVGTQYGLHRYDGRTFVVYPHDPLNGETIPSPVVGTLYEDPEGRLWIGSGWGDTGLALYERGLDRFRRFPHGPGSGGLSGHRVFAINTDGHGRLWVGTENALDLFDPSSGSVNSYQLLPRRGRRGPTPAILSMQRMADGGLWLGTNAGLYTFNSERGVCIPWSAGRASTELDLAEAWDLELDDQEQLWVATLGTGLWRVDPRTGRIVHLPPRGVIRGRVSHQRIRRLALDREGRLWQGTENDGITILDRRSGRWTDYMPDPREPRSLAANSIYALYADRQGVMWIGTYNAGLDFVTPYQQSFAHLGAGEGLLSVPEVGAILEDRAGNLWIGTDGGGLHRIDARTQRWTYYRSQATDPTTLGSESVFALYEAEDGVLWVGGWDAGLGRLDPRTGRVTRFRHDPRDAAARFSDHVWAIVPMPAGQLLLATQGGPELFDLQTQRFTHLNTRFPALGMLEAYSIARDRRGRLWLGQRDRVAVIDWAAQTLRTFEYDPQQVEGGLGRGMVPAIHVDSHDNVWIATEGGLSYLPAGSTTLKRYTTIHGLPHDSIAAILEDGQGNLWVSTNRGVAEILRAVQVPDSPDVLTFDVHDGLQGHEFTRGSAFRSRSGRLYFGGPRGLNSFLPEMIRRNPVPPPIVLTDLKIFNRSVRPGAPGSRLARSIFETQALTLTRDDSVVTLDFAALNLIQPQKNRYRYVLEGVDPEWTDAGTRATATYSNLPPGRHVFRVMASNNHGVRSPQGLALTITVTPRWHERLLVRVTAPLLLTLAIFAAIRRRERRILAHEQELERRVQQRTLELNTLNEELEQRVAARTAELADEKERLAVTLRSIGDGVIATAVDGRVVLMNRVAEELTGWPSSEALDRPLGEVLRVVDRDTREPVRDPVSAALGAGDVVGLPYQSLLLRRDGFEAAIAESAAPIRDRDGRAVGVVLVFRDVTERRRVEEQLQSAQKLEALGILAGGIAHDFNNLLTGIFGHIDLARSRSAGNTRAIDGLTRALSVLEKARGLTGQLLTFSRGGQPQAAALSLGDLLRHSIRFALSGSNVGCELALPDDLWPCRGDERQIDQLVDNLLLNARQAMPEGGLVRLVAENLTIDEASQLPLEPGRYVHLSVSDEGVGIPRELHGRVFEPFFTTKPTGSGLGLAISYSIVRKHGGHITLDSEPGRGTTVSVYLPASRDTPKVTVARQEEAPSNGEGRVLIVDDEDHIRDVAREMLEELGYRVEVVAEGEAALAAYERARAAAQPFDVVILDLTIRGGLGGVATLQRLRTLDPAVRAIASSGYSDDPVMADPRAHGFASRLKKPFALVELAEVVAEVKAGVRS